jgi:hypothetical protein
MRRLALSSTYSVSKFAQKSTEDNIVINYCVIDAMGFADLEKSDQDLLDSMREFLSQGWFILVISGAAPQTGDVIFQLMESFGHHSICLCASHMLMGGMKGRQQRIRSL